MVSFTDPRQGWIFPITITNAVMMLFVFPQRNDDMHIVFFPLQSTLRIMCLVKFPMPGNFLHLIVDIVPFYDETSKI